MKSKMPDSNYLKWIFDEYKYLKEQVADYEQTGTTKTLGYISTKRRLEVLLNSFPQLRMS